MRHSSASSRRAQTTRPQPQKARPARLLLALVARATAWICHDLLQALKARFSTWRREAVDALTPVLDRIRFEPLEPRLLMSADVATLLAPPPAGTETSHITERSSSADSSASPDAGFAAVTTFIATPAPHILAQVVITGAGTAQLSLANDGSYGLALSGTDAATQVELRTDGSQHVRLSSLHADSAVGTLDLGLGDLQGAARFDGEIGSLTLGDLDAASLDLTGPNASLRLGSVHNSGLVADQTQLRLEADAWTGSTGRLQAASMTQLSVHGAFDAALAIGAPAATGTVLTGVNIEGSVSGVWTVEGRSGSVQLGSTSPSWRANFGGAVTQLYIVGDAAGLVAASAIQVLQVGGSMRGMSVLVGANLGADVALGGSGADADSFKPGTLARLRVGGDMVDSKVMAGVDPTTGTVFGGNANRIQELVVGGAFVGHTQVVAPVFPAAVRVGGLSVAPSTLTQLQTSATDTTPPSFNAALLNDTGNSASDGLTQDPSLLLQAADASGIAGFEAALGNGAFQSIAATTGANGYTVDAAALAALAGGSLADGAYAIALRAIDRAGNRSAAASVAFVLDTAAPTAVVGLDPASDTGTAGDGSTTLASVKLTGKTSAGTLVALGNAQATADSQGNFSFANLALALGANSFAFKLTDAAGNSGTANLLVERTAIVGDTTPPVVDTLALVSDTGSSTTDRITKDPRVQGTVSDNVGVTQLLVALDATGTPTFSDLTSSLANGAFSLSKAQLDSLAGGSLADGAHSLVVVAVDAAGNRSMAKTLAFTLDTTAPAATAVGLAAASDSGTAGDLITDSASVTLVGKAAAGTLVILVTLSGRQATADAQGDFSFAGVALALGNNSFGFTLTDAAGNTGSASLAVQRIASPTTDTQAPVVATLTLVNDSGRSASDGITNDARIKGTTTDNVGTVKLLVALDAGATPVYSDLSAALAADGSFAIGSAQLATLAGGTLADGVHSLRVVAQDGAGNRSAAANLAFTLDTVAPTGGSFGISLGDALGGDTSRADAALVVLSGTAVANATISLNAQSLSAVATNAGAFQLPNVALALGVNTLTLGIADAAGNATTVSRTLTRVAPTAQADPVLEWNQITLQSVQRDVTEPERATRVLAIQSVAVYDTLAAIEGTPAFLVQDKASGPTSVEAAITQAAYRVLYSIYPAQRAIFDATLAADLAKIPDGAAKTAGIALGDRIANAVLTIRANDGYLDQGIIDDGSSEIGKWRPTGPMFLVAEDPHWASVRTFVLSSADEFRAPPPPALDSPEYAAAEEQVRLYGGDTSTLRTADQTQSAQFWADGGGSFTPPGHWNQIANQVATAAGNSLSANARLMAQLNVALADAAIACWDTKYTYDLWRPVTAINNADQDNNPGTVQDANWRPLLLTPPHPDYVSGHSTFSAAAAGILSATFGDNVAFSTTSTTLANVTRSFTSFSQAADEAGLSRIYAGIHTSLANDGGKVIGSKVANAVLARFALTEDTQAPSVVENDGAQVVKTNLTITGQVLDNLSGVASAQYSIDGGTAQALSLAADGKFSLTTAFALDGSQDGTHVITVIAKDAAGNISAGYTRNLTLDTKAPTLVLSSLANGSTLDFNSRLTGSVNTTGASTGIGISALGYSIDGGAIKSVTIDAVTGQFDQSLPLGDLAVGSHSLSLVAQDAAGNLTTVTRSLLIADLAPFSVTRVTPTDGSIDVGSTYRPQVYFSRAVNAATLTADSFYATGADGSKLATTLVPALDGSYVWMFFNNPMPGGSTVTLHLNGAAIRAAQDGGFLDADGNGTAGGDLAWSFKTVSTTSVQGTQLVGKVVDPGPDLFPMTFDDIRRGPDGVIHTADDVFLNPIAHAKVYIVGQEDTFTYTDAQGNFAFAAVPVGDVKLAVDGRTATNAPAGVFFPEMVMALQIKPGVINTAMGSMGTEDSRAANADRKEIYLPRVQTSALQAVSATQPTTITVDEKSAPQLTDEQRAALTLTVAPGAAIGFDGKPLGNVMIGINTVPPALVKDMLPEGVMQHTFDITIQAPGVDTFAAPVKITFPNVFNAAPGTKLNILSFDHTTGMLVINGTATVSADGKTVVSDDDSGIMAPGWHGMTPPGGCGGSGGPPPAPTPPAAGEKITVHDPIKLDFMNSDAGTGTVTRPEWTWTAPPHNPAVPPLPPIPGCEVPPHTTAGPQEPFINVTIEIDGPLGTIAKQLSDPNATPLAGYAFTLSPGTGDKKVFGFQAKSYNDIFGAAGFQALMRDQLYGAQIKITVVEQKSNGDRTRDIWTYYQYRWVDVVDATAAVAKTGNTAAFMRTFTDGEVRTKNVDIFLPDKVKTSFSTGNPLSPFDLKGPVSGTGSTIWEFDPTVSSSAGSPRTDNFDIRVADPVKSAFVTGDLKATGSATKATKIDINLDGFKAELKRVLSVITRTVGADAMLGTADDVYQYTRADGGIKTASDQFKTKFAGFFSWDVFTAAQLDVVLDLHATEIRDAVKADYEAVNVTFVPFEFGTVSADVTMQWKDLGSAGLAGAAQYDSNEAFLRPLVTNTNIGEAAKQWALLEALNQKPVNSGTFAVSNAITWTGPITFGNKLGNAVAHEVGHTFGLNDAYLSGGGGATSVAPMPDLMNAAAAGDGDKSFTANNVTLLQGAMGTQGNADLPVTAALKMYRDNINLPGSATGIQDEVDPTQTNPQLAIFAGSAYTSSGDTVDFANLALNAAGQVSQTLTLSLRNVGLAPLTFAKLSLRSGSDAFVVVNAAAWTGLVLAAGQSRDVTLQFQPGHTGSFDGALVVESNSFSKPVTEIALGGRALSATASARTSIGNNNLGAAILQGAAVQNPGSFKIENTGLAPLLISSIGIAGGGGSFALLGVPANLSTHPISLATGESFSFGASFSPEKTGLQRGEIVVATNDPQQSQLKFTAVGTGIASATPAAHWGNNYVGLVSNANGGTNPALNAISDDAGKFSFFLPPDEGYHLVVFDPTTGLVAHGYGTTANSGKGTDLTSSLVFAASTAPDSDGDGLPDDIEFAIGSNAASRDTNQDGIDDFSSIQQGLNPLGNLAVPTGVLTAASLKGTAEAVTVAASPTDVTQLTAYVATGSQGLAVLDVSKFAKPSVLAELDLSGTSIDVAVDSGRGLVAVAANDAGLHLIDVSDPAKPKLLQTIAFASPATAVQIRDGSAYVAVGDSLAVVDLNTGVVRSTLDLGTATITGIAIEGNHLYTMDSSQTLRAISIASDLPVLQGSLTLTGLSNGGGKLFVGNGVAYVASEGAFQGGFESVDVSNPAALKLLSGVDDIAVAGRAIALNGSGLGIAIGSPGGVFGANVIDVLDTRSSADTGKLVTRYTLPAAPKGVALANGLAFVADGTGGLQIVNYVGFDTLGMAPTVAITVDGVDVDPAKPGIQVLEGRTVQIRPTITDDVQVRNIELLVNGQVVSVDPAFPFELFAQAPSIASGGKTLTLQVRATDTGGNSTLSNAVVVDVVPDTFPPQVQSVSVADGAKRFFVRSIDVQFDEPLDVSRLSASGAHLVRAGADGVFGTTDDVAVAVRLDTRSFGQSLSVLVDGLLPPGSYRFTLDPAMVTDRAGNALAAPIVRLFSIRPASDVTATSGVPGIPTAPSANPGQQVGFAVPFDPATARATFTTLDSNGTAGTATVNATRWNTATGTAYFTVPLNAASGDIVVYGQVGSVRTDFADGTLPLQIVPVVQGVEVQSVSADGTSAVLVLSGFGFAEAAGSEYRFGSKVVLDAGAATGPDVQDRYDAAIGYIPNGQVTLTVPLSNGVFGAISVKTTGGTSASFTVSLASITSVAASGTPADAAKASANAGQAITLNGTGLSTATDVLLRYTDAQGNLAMLRLSPTTAASDGTSATLVLPGVVNGAFALQVFGSASQPLLQIVPTLSSFTENNGLGLSGSGFVEGASTIALPGASLADTGVNTGPDTTYGYNRNGVYGENNALNIAVADTPHYGQGGATVTTAGGTSAALALNVLRPGSNTVATGYLSDIAVDKTTGATWVLDNANPDHLLRINTATGAVLQTITLSSAYGPYSTTQGYAGLQVNPVAFSLGGVSVPAGSLVLLNGYGTNHVTAISQATGAVIAQLDLVGSYMTSGVLDASTGRIFATGQDNKLSVFNATTGALVQGFDLPFGVTSHTGMAIDPASGNLWIGSSGSGTGIVLFDRLGQEVRRLDLASQGITNGEISGLAFAADGALRVSSIQGTVHFVTLAPDIAVQAATLAAITGVATDGVPAQGTVASANVGQPIVLTGSHFNAGTRVLFEVRNADGITGQVAVAPLAINDAGTQLQVLVPDLATTGNVRVVNRGTSDLAGLPNYNDSVYRSITRSFTAGSSTAAVRFADGGLQGLNDESWGIDNVKVALGATTVFSDDFESGHKSQWSQADIDETSRGTVSRYAGRFSNDSQTLSLTGLTAGQTYTLSFDLLVLDTWDGNQPGIGPDLIDVSVDGLSLLHDSFSNGDFTNNGLGVQSFGASAAVRLQIVPTLSGVSGRPGEDDPFTLTGSGFMEGASTLTVGGVAMVDTASNLSPFDVSGTRNGTLNAVAPRTLDGPVRITTEGGYAQFMPQYAAQPTVQFSALLATADSAQPTDATKPSANTGQAIVLQGQGFTASTLVQFQGRDDTGATGTLTRTGTVSNNGTTLTLVVPALATTGAVTVLGSSTSINLQVVPTLRGVGGTLSPGQTIMIEGTGLSAADLVITVGGRPVGMASLQTIIDGSGNGRDQQFITLTVPTGASGNIVTVTTSGGLSTNRFGTIFSDLGVQTPAVEPGDTSAAAASLGAPRDAHLAVNASIGDGANGTKDVDLYKIDLNSSNMLRLNLASTTLYGLVRVFDATGTQLASRNFSPNDASLLEFTAPTTGTFTIGVSGYYNSSYDPAVADSGASSYTGAYSLGVDVQRSGSSRLDAIQASAASGTAARPGIASANTGQNIVLHGIGLLSTDRVVFTVLDDNGNTTNFTVAPVSVDTTAQTITVTVPDTATTGRVRIERDQVGILLQIVPTLKDVAMNVNQGFAGTTLTLSGSGFAEGASAVLFGAQRVDDVSRNYGLDVYTRYDTTLARYVGNGGLNLTVPNNVPTGPIRVSTVGGTSAAFGLSLTGITASADTGLPATAGQASAQPGQTISLVGEGLDTTSDVLFQVINASGVIDDVIVHPVTVGSDGKSANVVVPYNTVTGQVRVVGDANGSSVPLQIVPVVTDVQVQSIASDGSSAVIVLSGLGFVEGNDSAYRFGSKVVLDAGAATGPDVQDRYDAAIGYIPNGQVTLTVPLSNGVFGAISVKTTGGTSASFTVSLASITSVAASGTPADAAKASANAGQAITLNGTGLSTATDVLLRYTDAQGNLAMLRLSPTTAASDGTSATLVLPGVVNGAFALQVFGSASQPLLQIVPTLSSFTENNGLGLSGSGFVEGASTIALPGASLADTGVNTGPDTTYGYNRNGVYGENNALNIAVADTPHYGQGGATVTTAGGTSAALALNVLRPGSNTVATGYLSDIAVDKTTGATWVLDNANPDHLLRINTATGAVLQTITLSSAYGPYSTTQGYAGLQVNPVAFSLGGVSVPAGSLVLLNGYGTNHVTAISQATGAVIAQLDLVGSYMTSGVLDASTGRIFATGQDNKLSVFNATTGALVQGFDLPFGVTSHTGMAIDPASGNLWIGSSGSGTGIVLFDRLGQEVRRLDLASQGITNGEISGLAFAADGTLRVSSVKGTVHFVTLA